MFSLFALKYFLNQFPEKYEAAIIDYDGSIGVYNENHRLVAEFEYTGDVYFNYGCDLVMCRKPIDTPPGQRFKGWVCSRPLDHLGECGRPEMENK